MFKRIRIWKNRYKVWKEWHKVATCSKFDQFLILIGWKRSLAFEIYAARYAMREFVNSLAEAYSSIKIAGADVNMSEEDSNGESV